MVRNYRILVFALAFGYWLYQFLKADYSAFGLQFRFLTIWTLTANVIVALQMLRLSLGKTDTRPEAFVSLVVVMNMAVVVQYWRLYFIDPSSVSASGGIPWHQEYYLHLMGPMLMWADAFLLFGVFKRLRPVFIAALILGIAYPLWIELAVRPLNDNPVGSVTNGLPYPFLNEMELSGRLAFYGFSTIANFVFILAGWGFSRMVRPRRSQLASSASR